MHGNGQWDWGRIVCATDLLFFHFGFRRELLHFFQSVCLYRYRLADYAAADNAFARYLCGLLIPCAWSILHADRFSTTWNFRSWRGFFFAVFLYFKIKGSLVQNPSHASIGQSGHTAIPPNCNCIIKIKSIRRMLLRWN